MGTKTIGAAAGVALTVGLAAPAQADVDSFLDLVRQDGWHGSDAVLLDDAMQVCKLRHSGLGVDATVDALYQFPEIDGSTTTRRDMLAMIDFAEMNFCEQYFADGNY